MHPAMPAVMSQSPQSLRPEQAPAQELSTRWRLARRAACLTVTGQNAGVLEDGALLRSALALDLPQTLRCLYDNSLRLGESYVRFHGRRIALSGLPDLLASLGAPCLTGAWRPVAGSPAHALERDGCPDAGACDAWREATDGLVVGLSGARHARHRSRGHGDPSCVDVVFGEERSALRFGPVPEALAEALERARRSVARFDSTADVVFLGLSEGVLFYEIRHSGGRASNIDVGELVRREVRRRAPEVCLREAGSRAVLGPG